MPTAPEPFTELPRWGDADWTADDPDAVLRVGHDLAVWIVKPAGWAGELYHHNEPRYIVAVDVDGNPLGLLAECREHALSTVLPLAVAQAKELFPGHLAPTRRPVAS
jgi:hypothetical protein